MTGDPIRILVVCTGNRCRSQMAQGWLSHLLGENGIVVSAGTTPKGVHPMAVLAMAEVDVDISHQTSDHVDVYVDDEFDLVVTVCDSARETCPFIPGAHRTLHHSFEDPDNEQLDEAQRWSLFRRVRDEIEAWARLLVNALET